MVELFDVIEHIAQRQSASKTEVQLHIAAEQRLSWAKGADAVRLGPASPVLSLSYDMVEMIAAYLPARLTWGELFSCMQRSPGGDIARPRPAPGVAASS